MGYFNYAQTELVLLSPYHKSVPGHFRNVETSQSRYDQLLADMQRLRGSIYLEDGAIPQSALTSDGRHELSIDKNCWHIMALDKAGKVCCCLRYLEESSASSFDDLWIANASFAHGSSRTNVFRQAIEAEMATAARSGLGFGEVGGWAVASERRWTPDPLRLTMATCALMGVLGGSIGIATATVRHSSAAILRRIGLQPLRVSGEEIPPYYDPDYHCTMELLRFDTRFPNPKYMAWIQELHTHLATAAVISRGSSVKRQEMAGFVIPATPQMAHDYEYVATA